MPKATQFATDVLKAFLTATALASFVDNAGSSPATVLYLAFHVTDPGAGGGQNTGEAAYGGYARTSIARTSGGFTVASGVATNASDVNAPVSTSGNETLQFWSIGRDSSGAGKILWRGGLGSAKPIPAEGTASNDTVAAMAHGASVNDKVVFFALPGATLPTGITEGTVYFVKTVPDANSVTLSATQGGATLDLTANGAGVMQRLDKCVTISGANIQPQVVAGQLAISES